MKLFTVDKDGKLIQYMEHSFMADNGESDLEILLENNPECFFADSKILIIGCQVFTNLGTWIDLLGLDRICNTVVIELKRGKTPRETVSQLLEYASFIDNLDYEQLNLIYQNYIGEESSLETYHQEYFDYSDDQIFLEKGLDLYRHIIKNARNTRSTNSLVDFMMVAEGKFRGAINMFTKIWDIAAPWLIIREAGGKLKQLFERELSFDLSERGLVKNYPVIAGSFSILAELKNIQDK